MIHVLAFLAAAAAAPAAVVLEQPPAATGILGGCQEAVQDGGFEAGTVPTFWTQSSTNFGTPVCSVALCGTGAGTAGARTGSWWAWFGGAEIVRNAAASQSMTLPPGIARLRFYLWIGARSGNGTDAFRVLLDGTPVFTATEATPGYGSYTLVDLDVSAFATGGSHLLRFESSTSGPEITSFNVDDVSLDLCPVGSTAISASSTRASSGRRTSARRPAPPATSTACPGRPTRRWEAIVDGTSGDVDAGSGPSLVRLADDLSTVLQTVDARRTRHGAPAARSRTRPRPRTRTTSRSAASAARRTAAPTTSTASARARRPWRRRASTTPAAR